MQGVIEVEKQSVIVDISETQTLANGQFRLIAQNSPPGLLLCQINVEIRSAAL